MESDNALPTKMIEKMSTANEIITIDSFTSLPRAFFKLIGMPSVPMSGVLKIRVNYLYHAAFWNLGLCVFGEMVNIGRIMLGMENFTFLEITNLVLCIGFILMCFAKVLAVLHQSDRMHCLFTDLQAIHPISVEEQQLYCTHKYYLESRRVMQMYAFVQMLMIWCFNLSPLAETLMLYASTGLWEVVLPYPVYYPFDPYPRGLFEYLYVSQLWAAFVAATGILAVDMLLCGVVIQICMHFDVLKRNLTNFKPSGDARQDMAALKAYVAKHSETIRRVHVTLHTKFGIY